MPKNENRTRNSGAVVATTNDGAEIVAACRAILAQKQMGKINGTAVDTFSASAIVTVFDMLNADNKAKFLRLPIARMAAICFSLVK